MISVKVLFSSVLPGVITASDPVEDHKNETSLFNHENLSFSTVQLTYKLISEKELVGLIKDFSKRSSNFSLTLLLPFIAMSKFQTLSSEHGFELVSSEISPDVMAKFQSFLTMNRRQVALLGTEIEPTEVRIVKLALLSQWLQEGDSLPRTPKKDAFWFYDQYHLNNWRQLTTFAAARTIDAVELLAGMAYKAIREKMSIKPLRLSSSTSFRHAPSPPTEAELDIFRRADILYKSGIIRNSNMCAVLTAERLRG